MTFIWYRYNLFIIFLLLPLFISAQQVGNQEPIAYTDSHTGTTKIKNIIKSFNDYLQLSQFHREKDLDSALYYSEKALNLAVKEKENKNIAKSYQNIGLLMLKWGNLEVSKKNIVLARTYYYFDKDSTAVALMNLDLGIIYYQKTDLNQSLDKFLLAYDFFKTKKTSDKLVEVVNMIGRIYSDLEMIEKSQEFQTLSLKLSIELNNKEIIMASKNRMALLLVKQNKYSKATKCFEEAIELGMEDDSLKYELLTAFNGLAKVNFHKGEYELSLYCSNKSLKLLDAQEFPDKAIYIYHMMGMSHMGLKNYSKSESYLLKAYKMLAKISSNAPIVIECNKALYQLYKEIGSYKKALYHYQLFIHTKDNIYGKEINKKIIQLESDRERAVQNKAYSELQLKAENQKLRYDYRITYIITVCAILLTASFCLFLYYLFRNNTMKSEAELLFAKNRFNSLRSQMNSHFIFNVINGVQNYVLKAEKFKAYDHLTIFAKSIRLIINNASESFIPLEDELELIKTYIDLEKVRFRDGFEYKIDVDEKLDETNPLIPSMIIQPIVENSIIHGLSNKQGNGQLFINFDLSQNGRFIRCIVTDNGIGREEALKIKKNKTQEEHLSISTINSQQRIEILEKMGYEYTQISIEDLVDKKGSPAGTKVILNLPIK